MIYNLSRHLTHYLSLFGILGAGLFGLLIFQFDKNFQTAICVSSGISYVVWGITHHYIHEDLHLKIALEYIASAAFGVIVLLIVIWS